jgi:hypothetical protein
MLKLCFYVPESHLEKVRSAVFNAGAGRLGNYQECCWQVQGSGQFKPLQGANPALGSVDTLEHIAEYRVEMVCAEACVGAIIAALRNSHPYEEPAFDVTQVLEFTYSR